MWEKWEFGGDLLWDGLWKKGRRGELGWDSWGNWGVGMFWVGDDRGVGGRILESVSKKTTLAGTRENEALQRFFLPLYIGKIHILGHCDILILRGREYPKPPFTFPKGATPKRKWQRHKSECCSLIIVYCAKSFVLVICIPI